MIVELTALIVEVTFGFTMVIASVIPELVIVFRVVTIERVLEVLTLVVVVVEVVVVVVVEVVVVIAVVVVRLKDPSSGAADGYV